MAAVFCRLRWRDVCCVFCSKWWTYLEVRKWPTFYTHPSFLSKWARVINALPIQSTNTDINLLKNENQTAFFAAGVDLWSKWPIQRLSSRPFCIALGHTEYLSRSCLWWSGIESAVSTRDQDINSVGSIWKISTFWPGKSLKLFSCQMWISSCTFLYVSILLIIHVCVNKSDLWKDI